MAQALYLRDAEGNLVILNQREQYGDVQIALFNRDRELKRGGVITGEELFRLALECLNRQSAEKGDGSTRPLCSDCKFCPDWTESGCSLKDPAHECDYYAHHLYYHANDGSEVEAKHDSSGAF